MLLGRLDGNRLARRNLQFEPHDGFVHTANLFDSQCSITQPLTVQQEQL
jgi:hypothetical protein